MRRRIRVMLIALLGVLYVGGGGGAVASGVASASNYVLPNGCQIDGYHTYDGLGTASANTHEDANCEKIELKMRYFNINTGLWTTASTGYLANLDVFLSRQSNQFPDWSDHNGRRNGSDWGFRLN